MKQFLVHKTVAGTYVNNMSASPLVLFRNPEIAQVTKSRKDDKNTFRSTKFALFGSVVTELQYSSVTFFISSQNPVIISARVKKQPDLGRSQSRNLVQHYSPTTYYLTHE